MFVNMLELKLIWDYADRNPIVPMSIYEHAEIYIGQVFTDYIVITSFSLN